MVTLIPSCAPSRRTCRSRPKKQRHGSLHVEYVERDVDALGVIIISRGCFERCCSNNKTPPRHSNRGKYYGIRFIFRLFLNTLTLNMHVSMSYTGLALRNKDTAALAFTRYWFTSKLYCGSQYSLYCPPPTCKADPFAILLHGHCAIYAPPHRPSFCTPYTIQYW